MSDTQPMEIDIEQNGQDEQRDSEPDLIIQEDQNATAEQIAEAAKPDEPLEPETMEVEIEKPKVQGRAGRKRKEPLTDEDVEEEEEKKEQSSPVRVQPKRGGRTLKKAEPAKSGKKGKAVARKAASPEPVSSQPKRGKQTKEVKKVEEEEKEASPEPPASQPTKRGRKGKATVEKEEDDELSQKPASQVTESGRKGKISDSAEVNKKSVKTVPKHHHTYEEFIALIPCERLLTCGEGEQLGHPGRTTTKKPRAVNTFPEGTKLLQAVAGGIHTTILTTEHEVYSCGTNEKGTCPVKGLEPEESIDKMTIIEFSEAVKKEGKIIQLAAGGGFTAALTDLGSVIAWGDLRDPEGAYDIHDLFRKMRQQPTVILHHGDVVVVKVAAGANHLAMLSNQGEIYTFGEGTHGQLGNTTRTKSIRSKYVADFTGKSLKRSVLEKGKMVKFTDVFAGGYWTMARAEDGRIFVCGLNNFGQLGLPLPEIEQETDTEEQNKKLVIALLTPSPAFPSDKKWTHIAGVKHVIARNDESEVFGMGLNTDNELGIGTYMGKNDEEHWRYFELQKVLFPDEAKIAGITATLGATIAWTHDGRAFSFGFDSVGQLGLGITEEDEKSVKVPAAISSAHLEGYKIISVSIADSHAVFLAQKTEK